MIKIVEVCDKTGQANKISVGDIIKMHCDNRIIYFMLIEHSTSNAAHLLSISTGKFIKIYDITGPEVTIQNRKVRQSIVDTFLSHQYAGYRCTEVIPNEDIEIVTHMEEY